MNKLYILRIAIKRTESHEAKFVTAANVNRLRHMINEIKQHLSMNL